MDTRGRCRERIEPSADSECRCVIHSNGVRSDRGGSLACVEWIGNAEMSFGCDFGNARSEELCRIQEDSDRALVY